jgi:hypothetical protein
MRKPAIHAGVTTIDRPVKSGGHRGDGAVSGLHVQAAADAAEAAGGAGDRLDRPRVRQAWLDKRTRGAGVHAAPACHAWRVDPQVVGAGHQHRIRPAAGDRQGVSSLDLVAHAYATSAGDAQIGVEPYIWVGVVDAVGGAAVRW